MSFQSIHWNHFNVSFTRIYQSIPFELDVIIRLDANASHHVARVLRAKIDDTLILFNGDGNDYSATIVHIDKKSVDVMIRDCTKGQKEPSIDITLAQGIARGDKMDFIIQKAVELGVTSIFPLITERCNVKLESKREARRLEHWQLIIISACEQSGRTVIPAIFAPQTLSHWLMQLHTNLCFVLSPHVQNKLPNDNIMTNPVTLLLGPEGGLSDNEMALAVKNNFLPLNLGPRVLRTETATIAALTAIQLRYGDFN
jgi:16S rRNA (uracil1498-N3)-methyltransferase